MAGASRRVVAEPLTVDAWAPFGWIPVADTDPADGMERLTYEWADPHVNVISHAADEIERDGEELICDRLYRHDTHTQVLLALNGPSVLAVAPADVDLDTDEGLDTVLPAGGPRGPRAAPGQAGTTLGAEPVLLFNVQGLGYARDNASADLASRGVRIAVVAMG